MPKKHLVKTTDADGGPVWVEVTAKVARALQRRAPKGPELETIDPRLLDARAATPAPDPDPTYQWEGPRHEITWFMGMGRPWPIAEVDLCTLDPAGAVVPLGKGCGCCRGTPPADAVCLVCDTFGANYPLPPVTRRRKPKPPRTPEQEAESGLAGGTGLAGKGKGKKKGKGRKAGRKSA